MRKMLPVVILCIVALPVLAQPDCDLRSDAVAGLDHADLIDAYVEIECESVHAEVATELRRRLDRNALDADHDEEQLAQLSVMLAHDALRAALKDRDLERSRAALDELEAALESTQERTAADAKADADPDAVENDELFAQLQNQRAIRDVLDGRTPPASQFAPEPMPGWTLSFGFCGTPALSYYMSATRLSGVEDAWAAVGRDDLAIDRLLANQWLEAFPLGMVPPRLREFGERMLGATGYDREVEAALAGIRIDDGATGRVASIPLLGHWLPLPTAVRHWNEEHSQPFDNAEALAAWLRPMLAGQ